MTFLGCAESRQSRSSACSAPDMAQGSTGQRFVVLIAVVPWVNGVARSADRVPRSARCRIAWAVHRRRASECFDDKA